MARFDDDYYTEIKKDMVSAFRKLGFIRIPVDPVELMGACGIHAIPYLSAFDQGELMNLTLLTDCPSGVSFALREEDGTETRYAAYNNFESSGRTRFTAMHEFCHCFFNHRESSEVAERIADFGPGYALAPPCPHRLSAADHRLRSRRTIRRVSTMRLRRACHSSQLASPSQCRRSSRQRDSQAVPQGAMD